MTDDDTALYPALKTVYGPGVLLFLCHWHINENFKKHLNPLLKENPLLKDKILMELKLILEETDSEKFLTLLEKFVQNYDNMIPTFIDYFFKYYCQNMRRIMRWSSINRKMPHANSETNMFLESFHNVVKTRYMKRKSQRRMDYMVLMLEQVELEYYRKSEIPRNVKVQPIKQEVTPRHKRGLKIPKEYVFPINDHLWLVQSEKDNTRTYEVQFTQTNCDNTCTSNISKCKKCKFCRHNFRCECDDFKKGYLCKHLHRIYTLYKPVRLSQETFDPNPDRRVDEPGHSISTDETNPLARLPPVTNENSCEPTINLSVENNCNSAQNVDEPGHSTSPDETNPLLARLPPVTNKNSCEPTINLSVENNFNSAQNREKNITMITKYCEDIVNLTKNPEISSNCLLRLKHNLNRIIVETKAITKFQGRSNSLPSDENKAVSPPNKKLEKIKKTMFKIKISKKKGKVQRRITTSTS